MSAPSLRIAVPPPETVPRLPAGMPQTLAGWRVDPCASWALADTQTGALIVGDTVGVLRVLSFIWPSLRKPVFWCETHRLSLPSHAKGTLVLKDAHAFDADEQRLLLDWLHGSAQSPRLIATSSPVLFPLVEEGKFSRDLYQRFTALKIVIA